MRIATKVLAVGIPRAARVINRCLATYYVESHEYIKVFVFYFRCVGHYEQPLSMVQYAVRLKAALDLSGLPRMLLMPLVILFLLTFPMSALKLGKGNVTLTFCYC